MTEKMSPPAMIGIGIAAVLILGLVFLPVWVIVFGCAPLWASKITARLIRWMKGKKGLPGYRLFNATNIDDHVYLGSLPHGDHDLIYLKQECYITSIVTLNESWELPGEATDGGCSTSTLDSMAAMGFRCLWLNTPDYCPVSVANLTRGVDFIIEEVAKGGRVFVHCNAGRGRSTCVVLAYLIKTNGWDAHASFDFVKRKRNVANLSKLWGTRPQWRSVCAFQRSLRHHPQVHKLHRHVFPESYPRQDMKVRKDPQLVLS